MGDPDLAQDLACAAVRSCRSRWCVTVTDQDGHAIGHGCTRPAPATGRGKRDKPGGHDPPGEPRFAFTPAGPPGPSGGYGTRRFTTGIPGQQDMLIEIGPLPTENAITGGRPTAMTRASCSGTWPRSGAPRAQGPAATARRPDVISSITFRARLAVERVCVMGTRSAGSTTG